MVQEWCERNQSWTRTTKSSSTTSSSPRRQPPLVHGWDLIDEFTLLLRSADGRNVAIQLGPDEDIVYA